MIATRELFGFAFIDDHDSARTVERILGPQPSDGLLPLVVTPNVDDIVRLHEPRHAELAAAERRARYVLPDGQPIVWSSRLLGRPLTARIPGSSLFPLLWRRVVDEGRPAVVVAPSRTVGEALQAEHHAAGVVVPPYFDVADPAALGAVLDECETMIDGTRPELVVIGIGFPKQQHIATGLIERLESKGRDVPVFLLLGGSLDLYLGRVRRAPDWVQRVGLEWFYRFLCEPRRLFRRYFVTDMRFVPLVVEELRQERRGRTRKEVARARA